MQITFPLRYKVCRTSRDALSAQSIQLPLPLPLPLPSSTWSSLSARLLAYEGAISQQAVLGTDLGTYPNVWAAGQEELLGRQSRQVQWPVANAVINDAIDMRRVELEGLRDYSGMGQGQERHKKNGIRLGLSKTKTKTS